ncbi:MAG: hypothetical protein AAGI06_05740, partial [Pseudomonadota bacterium]
MSDNYTLSEKAVFRPDQPVAPARESFSQRARRIALGTAFVLMPARIGELPYLLGAMARDVLGGNRPAHASRAEDRA